MEQNIIINSFRLCFGREDHLWLFGSRVDDKKKGGDIDLYVETYLDTEEAIRGKFSFLRIVKEQIGDQRIDIVLNVLTINSPQSIYSIAKAEGIQLT